MSLMTYKDAYPWAEAIRAELISGHMPPWNADEGFGSLKRAHTLTARELDVVLTWATGGNPQGSLDQTLPPVGLKNEWPMGAPDLTLKLPADFTVPADKLEVTEEFTLPTGSITARWVRAVDLLPGNPSVVRSAVNLHEGRRNGTLNMADTGARARAVLPGNSRAAGGSRRVSVTCRRRAGCADPLQEDVAVRGTAPTDRSTVGVYFAADTEAQELLTLPMASAQPAANDRTITFNRTIDEDVQALALRPDQIPPNIVVQVQAVLPDGSHTEMIRWNSRPDWGRRYWFEKPIALPRGSRIEVVANLDNPDILSEAFALADAKPPVAPPPLRLAINVIPAKSKLAAP